MTASSHPLWDRLLHKVGARPDEVPSLDAWRALGELVVRTYRDADQDRYTIERAMEISSQEMRELYDKLQRQAAHEVAALRESDERHRVLFEANPLPVWLVDCETLRFADVNSAMVRLYGYTREEFLAMPVAAVKMPEDVPEMVREVAEAPHDAIQRIGLRRHRRKDGSLLEMDITVHAILMSGRRYLLGIAMDMTQARRIEEELRQAQKMEAVGRLAGGIAHDFNNILAVILANAELALEPIEGDAEVAAGIEEIRKAAVRAAGLTRQLLTFSRKQKREPRALDLNPIVAGVKSMLTRIVGEDIALTSVTGPDLGTIETDPCEVEQVIMNLAVNARDAMPAGGCLLLETSNVTVEAAHAAEIGVAPGAYVMLSVSDTGCGMTRSVRERIFEPFFTTKSVDKGTGLGLATVFGIVKESRGGITVYSEPDRGTTFRIYWPRIDAAVEVTAEAAATQIQGSGTVLVVEDDPQLRAVLRRYLTSWGYTLLEAPTGAAALELARGHLGPIDLVLTDLVMPGGVDGRALGQQLVTERPATQVVYMSGYSQHAALQGASLRPEDPFVQKPFSARALGETLARTLAAHRPASDRVT